VSKFYARPEDCQEQNGMMGLQTSGGKNDLLTWDMEECHAWYTEIVLTSQRPIAWTSGVLNEGTCQYEETYVWIAGINNGQADSGRVIRLNGDDGSVDEDLAVPELTVTNYGPYGGAVDFDNHFWFITKASQLVRVDFDTLDYEIWPVPDGMWAYGFTVDSKGRPWIGGFTDGLARFDPDNETWDLQPAVQGFGIQEDAEGRMWTATTPGFGDGVHSVDSDTMAPLDHVALPEGTFTKGVSIDFYGYVWVVDQSKYAFKVDPDALTYEFYDGLDSAYTYSDMTGWGLANVADPEG
jgi:hypothetical protein